MPSALSPDQLKQVADQTKFTDEMTKKSPPVPTGAPQPVKEWLRQQTVPVDPTDKFGVGRRKFEGEEIEDVLDKMNAKFGPEYMQANFSKIWQELGNYFPPSQMRNFLRGGSWIGGRNLTEFINKFGNTVGLGQTKAEDYRQAARNELGVGNQRPDIWHPSSWRWYTGR
jgi:hypothetical protein